MLPDQDIARQLAGMQKSIEALERQREGAIKEIDESLLTVAAASFDFQNIPTIYKHLALIGYMRSDRAATSDAALLRFNNDVGANYDTITVAIAHPNVLATGDVIAGTSISLDALAGNTAPANVYDLRVIFIPHYANTINNKVLRSLGALKLAAASGFISAREAFGWWRDNSAINRITVFPSAGANWLAGSIMTLYGIA